MRFPEFLFRLARAPESTGPLVELFARSADITSNFATSLNLGVNGPAKDKVLVVTNMTVDINPGAAQQILRCVISGQTPGGLIWGIHQEGFTEVDAFRTAMNWAGEVAIGGGGVDRSIVIFDAVFDGNVNNNAITVGVFGYVIPRGNIAPF